MYILCSNDRIRKNNENVLKVQIRQTGKHVLRCLRKAFSTVVHTFIIIYLYLLLILRYLR
jgi:hypothetical protein